MPKTLTCSCGQKWRPRADDPAPACPACRLTWDDSDFGPLVLELHAAPSAIVWSVLALVALVLGAGALILVIVSVRDLGDRIAGVVAAALAALGAIFMSVVVLGCSRARLCVYERGLARRTLFGEVWLAYDEVEEVRLNWAWSVWTPDPRGGMVLFGPDREKVKQGVLRAKPYLEAMSYVYDRVVPRLGKEIRAALDAGDEENFGPVRASEIGLHHRSDTIGWDEFERADFSPEGMRIFARDRPESTIILPTKTLDALVLMWLCGAMTQVAQPRETAPAIPNISTAASADEPLTGFPAHDPELGRLLCGRPRRPWLAPLLGGLALGCLAGAVFCLVQGNHHGDFTTGAWWCLGIGGALAATAVLVHFKMGFGVYEDGLRTPTRSLRWDECDHISYGVVDQYVNGAFSGRNISLRLEGAGQSVAIGGSGARMEGHCTAVLDRVLGPLIQRRWQDIQEGDEIVAGKYALSADGISFGRKHVDLADIAVFDQQQGYIYVWQGDDKKPFVSLPSSTKDALVFVNLLGQLLQRRGTTEARRRER